MSPEMSRACPVRKARAAPGARTRLAQPVLAAGAEPPCKPHGWLTRRSVMRLTVQHLQDTLDAVTAAEAAVAVAALPEALAEHPQREGPPQRLDRVPAVGHVRMSTRQTGPRRLGAGRLPDVCWSWRCGHPRHSGPCDLPVSRSVLVMAAPRVASNRPQTRRGLPGGSPDLRVLERTTGFEPATLTLAR
jgi:hypothetical protein